MKTTHQEQLDPPASRGGRFTRALLGVAAIAAALALATGCGGGNGESGGEGPVSLQLGEQADSGQSGTATLSAQGSKTRVVITLSSAAAGPQPSHIHEGSCEKPNPQPAFALSNIENGKAETSVDVPLEKLQGDGDYYINVHKSDSEYETVVACSDITEGGGAGEGGVGYGGGY